MISLVEKETLTNNHASELETFLDRLAVDLVRKIGETNIASKLLANHIDLYIINKLNTPPSLEE